MKIIQLRAATESRGPKGDDPMAKEAFEERRFAAKTAKVIEQANEIMEEYSGDQLTLRQLHYQFVARDLYENTMRNYKKFGLPTKMTTDTGMRTILSNCVILQTVMSKWHWIVMI